MKTVPSGFDEKSSSVQWLHPNLWPDTLYLSFFSVTPFPCALCVSPKPRASIRSSSSSNISSSLFLTAAAGDAAEEKETSVVTVSHVTLRSVSGHRSHPSLFSEERLARKSAAARLSSPSSACVPDHPIDHPTDVPRSLWNVKNRVFSRLSHRGLCKSVAVIPSSGGGGSTPPPSSSEPHAAWKWSKWRKSKPSWSHLTLSDTHGFALTQKAELLVSSRGGSRSRTGLFFFC